MAYINGKKILQVVKTQFVPAVYQEKTISPANFQREVVADSGYAALSKVKINGVLVDPHTEIESQNDNSVKYQKVIPNNVLTYGGLSKLGGLTYKNGDTLDYAYTKKVDIKGFNIWDEEWENGRINKDTGDLVTDSNYIRSKNFIRVIPNQTYYFKKGSYGTSSSDKIIYYDENYNYVDYYDFENRVLTMPSNVCYVKFYAYNTTYNNDICINVSNTTLNDTYKPYYNNALLEAKIIAIKQKLIQLGYSADVLGYGLNNVYNYIDLENKQVVIKMNSIDMGDQEYRYNTGSINYFALDIPDMSPSTISVEVVSALYQYIGVGWSSDLIINMSMNKTGNEMPRLLFRNDTYTSETAFKTAMSGVPLIYELATPITVDISDILDNDDIIGLLESGGTITFENDEKYNLPSDVTYLVEVE